MSEVSIERIASGYLVTWPRGRREAFGDLRELFEALLIEFEGRSDTFRGECFGAVFVIRNEAAWRLMRQALGLPERTDVQPSPRERP